MNANVAQVIEHATCNGDVVGLTPTIGSKIKVKK